MTASNHGLQLGDALPHVQLPMTGDINFDSQDYRGQNMVIYFYPKDSTPGCTTEGNEFSANIEAFKAANCQVFGVSRDSMRRHDNFKAKQDFKIELISDEDEHLCGIFDVIKLKKLYGKEYLGIDRSTFVINGQGELVKMWRKVKVKGHVDEVLAFVQRMEE